jgi:hypothetical protein
MADGTSGLVLGPNSTEVCNRTWPPLGRLLFNDLLKKIFKIQNPHFRFFKNLRTQKSLGGRKTSLLVANW